MKLKICVALQSFGQYSPKPLEMLKADGADVIFNKMGHRLNQGEIIELGHDCSGIIAGVEPYDKEVLASLKKLKCISRCGVGIDSIDTVEARRRGIVILNTPDAVARPVAEMTLAMIFDLLRLLTLHTTSLRAGRWERLPGQLLQGRSVGIVGLGRVGKMSARMLVSLGADVYGSDIEPDIAWAKENNVKILPISELLESVDILCIHVSLLKGRSFFLGEKEISRLKKGAIVINTSRGQAIDEKALYEALKSGCLGGAGLDVFSEEPYHGPLVGLDNVVLTPHVASLTVESRDAMEIQAVRNILAYFKNGK